LELLVFEILIRFRFNGPGGDLRWYIALLWHNLMVRTISSTCFKLPC